MTDPIADMLTRIRNAGRVHRTTVHVPYSKHKMALADILQREGYLTTVERVPGTPTDDIVITLKYEEDRPAIRQLRRISTPGHRVYVTYHRLPHVVQDMGIAIVSTPQGLMTNKRARRERLGGEILCEVF
ncbi:MAG: 30S ribosomal protein S8 [Candidatus Kerfeldbacteria bacterium]|nr:30S ribosomal protein S8 [Candidatus Kerfeldbacteria bacterium]